MASTIDDQQRQVWSLRVKRLDDQMRNQRLEYERSIAATQSVCSLYVSGAKQTRDGCGGGVSLARHVTKVHDPVKNPVTRVSTTTVTVEEGRGQRSSTPDSVHTIKAGVHGSRSPRTSKPTPTTSTTTATATRANPKEKDANIARPRKTPSLQQPNTALRRAVADLTDELRATKDALQVMKAEIDGLQRTNGDLRRTITNISEQLGTTQLELKATTSQAHAAAQGHIKLKNTMDGVDAEQFSLRVAMESSSAEIAALREASRSDDSTLAQRLDNLDRDVQAIHNVVTAMNIVVSTLDMPQLRACVDRQHNIQGEVTKLWSTVDGLKRMFVQATSTKNNPAHSVPHPEVQAALKKIEDKMHALEKTARVEAAAEKHATTGQLTEQGRKQDGLQKTFKEMASKIEALEGARADEAIRVQPTSAVHTATPSTVEAPVRTEPQHARDGPRAGDMRQEKVNLWFKSFRP